MEEVVFFGSMCRMILSALAVLEAAPSHMIGTTHGDSLSSTRYSGQVAGLGNPVVQLFRLQRLLEGIELVTPRRVEHLNVGLPCRSIDS